MAGGPIVPSPRRGIQAALSSFAAPGNQKSKSSNVRVVARVRPMSQEEKARGCVECIQPINAYIERTSGSPVSVAGPSGQSPRRTLLPFAFLSPAKKSACDDLPKRTGSHKDRITSSDTPPRPPVEASQTGSTPVTRNINRHYTSLTPPPSVRRLNPQVHTSLTADKKQFDFDVVFDPDATQKEVYDRSVGDAVRRNIFRGYNTTIIAYGQTGSGKTFTMGGRQEAETAAKEETSARNLSENFEDLSELNGLSPKSMTFNLFEDDGIIPRAVQDLFRAKQRHESAGEVIINLTYLEIYNDELRDLLIENNSSLKLRDHGDGVMVDGLTSVEVKSAGHIKALMDKAAKRRTTGSTHMNVRSSRSHAICNLLVTIKPALKIAKRKFGNMGNRTAAETIRGKLSLVDLAGSERLKQTGVMGIKKQESININKDLFVLAKVISALSEKSRKSVANVHVPYRDSKLTRLLRDSLGGNCCTVMVACISPADANIEESVNTLRYAERTKAITNTVKQNVEKAVMSPSESAAMRRENKFLKTKVLEMKKRIQEFEKENKPPPAEESIASAAASVTQTSELTNLQKKLKKAKEEAQTARELSSKAAVETDKWKLHYEKLLAASAESGFVKAEAHAELSELESNTIKAQRSEIMALKEKLNRESTEDDDDTSCLTYELSLVKGIKDDLIEEDSQSSTSHDGDNRNDQVATSSMDYLSCESHALKMENRSLSAENKNLVERIATQRKEVANLEEQIENCKAQLTSDKETKSEQEVNSAVEERDALQVKYVAQGHEIGKLQDKLQSALDEINVVQEELECCKRQNVELLTKLNEKEETKSDLLSQLNEETTLRIRYEENAEHLHQETGLVSEERDVLRVRYAVQEDEIRRLQDELQSYVIQKNDVEKLREELHALKHEKSELLERVEEKENCISAPPPANRGGENHEGDKRHDMSQESREILCEHNVRSDRHEIDEVKEPEKRCFVEGESILANHDELAPDTCKPVFDDTSLDTGSDATTDASDHNAIRVHAAKMLFWATKAIERGQSARSATSSVASSIGSEFMPTTRAVPSGMIQTKQIHGLPPRKIEIETNDVISNLDQMSPGPCSCQRSLFSGNAEHVEFYLPKLGMACTCGKQPPAINTVENEDPMSLENILRPWQVDFLKTVGITTAVELVHANNQRGAVLAKEMRKWRKAKKMVAVKTKSCGIALHIWSRTSKAVARSVRKQLAQGVKVLTKPKFLEVSIPSDTRSLSTLGCGSIIEMESLEEV